MNRRALLQGVLGASAALVLPATLQENAESARRWWALGGMPEREQVGITLEALRRDPALYLQYRVGIDPGYLDNMKLVWWTRPGDCAPWRILGASERPVLRDEA